MARATATAVLLALAALLAGATGTPAATAARTQDDDAQPWRAAATVRDRLFDAQTALLLDEGGAGKDVARAAAAYEGTLQDGISAAAPDADAEVRRGLRAARRARSSLALAAARGTVQGALYRGAAAVTADAARRGDVTTATSWLKLREFRTPTRYTRPGADATLALRGLQRRRTTPAQARLAVVKDLLDATQARARERADELARLTERGFAARRAELAAQLAATWPLLAPRLADERDPAARAAADKAFTALRQAAVANDDAAVEAARAQVTQALGSFTAAPLTEDERARRAIQLSKFVSLIPVEYDHGVEDTRVTAEFEIGEGIAFSKAARAAFSDLQGTLSKMDAGRTAEIDRQLTALDGVLRGAQEHPTQVPAVDTVKDQTAALEDDLSAVYPDAWEEQSDEGDFDLIQISLDRMEQQIAAGQYRQAEQTRVETYAVFEFGPERRLAAFDQGLANDIEGLIWFGAKGEDGLAQLISHHASRQQIAATRDELDTQLENAAATLGDGASEATVVTNAAIIVFREGLEGVLILAAITASFVGANRRKKRPVLYGALAGLAVSVLTFILAVTFLSQLQQYGEKLEAVVGLIAIGVLLLVMNWFFHKVYWTEWISGFHQRRKALLAKDDTAKVAFWSAQVIGLFTLGLSSVYREGFETVLFLQSLELSAGLRATVLGSLLGLAATGAVAVLTFRLQRKLPYKKMLIVTGVLLAFVLVIMVGSTIRTLQGAGWFPITTIDLEIPYWAGTWLGVFPTWETLGGQVAALVLVIGSYFAAEYVRVKRPQRRRAKKAREAATATN